MLESLTNNIFTYKKLTEEEQQNRGILGRLVGIIADTKNPTRNGRQYSASLWENVFNDPIMQEKIENRCCFGELGHPADREEVDPEKIAICLAEKPKLSDDGKLYGVFDILNTPCGKILKSLCDYGTNIGVSSRGSGDIMDNDEVDPNTYYCECWDAVMIPAVKSARPQFVTESLDTRAAGLRKALKESYEASSDEDKKVMKEALNDLDIKLEEDDHIEIDWNNIPWSKCENEIEENTELIEEAKEEETEEPVKDEEPVKELEIELEIEENKGDSEESKKEESNEDQEEEESAEETEELPEEDSIEEPIGELINSEEEIEQSEAYTVGELIKEIEDYDKELNLEFKPIIIDGKEYPVEMLGFDDSEDGKLIISVGYNQEIGDNINEVEEEIPEDEEEIATEEEVIEEPKEDSEEAEDIGDEEVIESLKETIRQKDLLENEIKNLKESKAVSDAEVKDLKEELNKYKVAFTRISEVAAKTKTYEAEINSLNEQINQKNEKINSLKEQYSVKLKQSLNESAETQNNKINTLTEKLSSKQKELEDTESRLIEQTNTYKQKLTERTEVAKKYKTKFTEAVNKYINFRASMLGIRPAEITNRLNENFTLNDIDSVCDDLLESNLYVGNLSLGINKQAKVKITESKQPNKITSNFDDECYKDLLDLADLN